MTGIKDLIIVVIWLLLFLNPYRGECRDKVDKSNICITGRIVNGGPDSLELHYYYRLEDQLFPHNILSTQMDSSRKFRFTFSNKKQKICWVNLLIKHSDPTLIEYPGIATFFSITNGIEIIEPGDSINFDVIKNGKQYTVVPSGRGYEKYICRAAVNVEMQKIFDSVSASKNEGDQVFKSVLRRTCDMSLFNTAFKVVEQYQGKITDISYEIIKADMIGDLMQWSCLVPIIRLLDDAAFGKDQSGNQQAKKLFHDCCNRSGLISPEIIVLSNRYIDYLKIKNQIELRYISTDRIDKPYSLSDMYYYIKSNYTGILREHMIFNFLFSGNSTNSIIMEAEDVDSLWVDAFSVIKDGYLKNLVWQRISRKSKGTGAFKFNLPDISGNRVGLDNLRGKVLLIDVWYTGCVGCLGYSGLLKEKIYPVFKDNKNLVFVSISGDKSQHVWRKSVKEGRYTIKNGVDLYTEGLGFNHPFFKFYGFNGGPYSLIIGKDGNIYDGDPPRMDMDKLIELIWHAINEQ